MALLPCVVFATTTINQSFVPDTIFQGDTSTYTVKIWNDSTSVAVTDVAFTALLNLPGALPAPKISVIQPLDTSVSGCGAGALSVDPLTNSVRLTGATVAAGTGPGSPGECVVTVKVSATASGNHIVSIPKNTDPAPAVSGFTYTENGSKEYNTTDANATLLVRAMAAPTGSKSFNPSPSFTGRPTTLTITLTNPNAGVGQTMPLTSFTDTLPTGMVVAPTPNASVTCTGTGFSNGTVTANPGDGAVTLTGGTIGVVGTCEMKVDVVVNALTPAGATSQTLANIVAAGAIGNVRGLSSPSFHQQVQVKQPISLAKSFTPSTIPVNAPSTMKIVVTNNGGAALTNAGFVDNFPAGLVGTGGAASVTCTSGINGTVTVDAGLDEVTLAGATIAANGGTCTVEVPVTSATEGAYKNELPVDAVSNDEGISSPAIDATLNAYAQLQVEKTVTPAKVAPGQWATFTVNIRNYANGNVTNAQFTDVLPTVNGHDMVVDGSQAPTSTCGMGFTGTGTNTLTGTGGTIPGATMTAPPSPGLCTVTFRAKVPDGAFTGETFINTLPTNTAATGDGPGGTHPVNTNTVSRNVAVVDAVDLTKVFNPTSIASGQTSQLTITVFNRTLNAMSGIDLTDNLPVGLVLAANPAASTTCGAGALTAVPGDIKITLTGGTALARPDAGESASCTITALVTATAPAT